MTHAPNATLTTDAGHNYRVFIQPDATDETEVTVNHESLTELFEVLFGLTFDEPVEPAIPEDTTDDDDAHVFLAGQQLHIRAYFVLASLLTVDQLAYVFNCSVKDILELHNCPTWQLSEDFEQQMRTILRSVQDYMGEL